MTYNFLLDIALILLFTKVLSIINKTFDLPQIVGAILAGVLLGPSAFGILKETELIQQLAELGVIGIMFSAGLSVNLSEIKKVFKSSFLIAMLGVIVPIAFGIVAMTLYNGEYSLETLFVGIIFSATSVAISVETLKEMNKLNSKVGKAILTAAVIDDVLGIVALTIGMGIKNGNVNVFDTLVKVILYFAFALLMGIIFEKIFKLLVNHYKKDMRRFVIYSFVFCLLMAYAAEVIFGISAIVGAFISGMVISDNIERNYIKERFEVVQYMLLSPMFFASIGLEVVISEFNIKVLLLTFIFVLVAITSKILGCGIGALLTGYSKKESLQIGAGMIARGEVVLVIAKTCFKIGIITNQTFTAIILTVIIAAISAPLLIKLTFQEKKEIKESNT